MYHTFSYVFADKCESAVTELNHARNCELLWIRAAQIQLCRNPHFEKLKGQFGLFLDKDGVWRCGGRLSKAEIPYDVRHPILLPRQHHLATLVVRCAHFRILHNGVKETLTEVRSKFWIVKGRAFVRKCIHQCVVCKKLEGNPLWDLLLRHCQNSECSRTPFHFHRNGFCRPCLYHDWRRYLREQGMDMSLYLLCNKSSASRDCTRFDNSSIPTMFEAFYSS